jgi:hypothetical protein
MIQWYPRNKNNLRIYNNKWDPICILKEGEKRSQRKKGIPKQKYIHKMFKNWSVFAEDCYMHYRDGYLFPD